MIYAIIEWTCTIAALAAFGYRWATLSSEDRDPAQVALAIYFLGSFVSFFVGLDLISPHIAALFHSPNITIILSHGAVIVLTAAQQVVLTYWSNAPEVARHRARRRVAAYGAVLVVLVIMFFLILPPNRHGTSETASLLNMSNKGFVAYLVLFNATAAVGQVITLRMSWTYSKITDRVCVRNSMRTVVVGAALILVYGAMRLAEIIGTNVGVDMTPWDPIQWLAGDFGSLLQLLGWTAPGWAPLLVMAGRWIVNYGRYQQLRPLWLALHEVTPEIALDAPRSHLADLVLVRDLNYRLYRRVIEILDGRRALRPYLAPDRVDVPGDEAREALQLHTALHAKAEGRPPAPAAGPAAGPAQVLDENFTNEIRRMVALAKAFRRSDLAGRSAMSEAGT